jgi:hypothetical protein
MPEYREPREKIPEDTVAKDLIEKQRELPS